MNENRMIKIFEDSQNQVQLSPQEEKDILAMKSIIGDNNLILQADGKLFIRHYVGFIQVNKTRLLIYPKISKYSNSEDIFNKSFNILIKLLCYSGYINIKNIPSPQFMNKLKGDLLELFVSIFIDELLRLINRDLNRSYNQGIENQTYIKGKIDFSETIKKNIYRKHKHYVIHDEFTENILMNQIFKAVIQNLLARTTIKENKFKLRQGLLYLEDVDNISLSDEVWDKMVFTRLNSQFKTVFNMAKLFYYNSTPNLNKGDELTFSFLVPVNQLFEKYLYKVLLNNSPSDIDIEYQGPIKYLARKNGKNYMKVKPDISISREDQTLYILDAKYKEVEDTDDNLSILRSDIYQMVAYSLRYNCNSIALLYPKFLEDKNNDFIVTELEIENNKFIIRIKIAKINLEAEPEALYKDLRKIL